MKKQNKERPNLNYFTTKSKVCLVSIENTKLNRTEKFLDKN